MELLLDHTQDCMALLSFQGDAMFRYELVNQAFVARLGLAGKSILGMTPVDVFGEEIGIRMQSDFLRCVQDEKVLVVEERIELGETVGDYQTTLTPIRKENGRELLIVTKKDVTALHSATISFRTEKMKSETFFEMSPIAMFILNERCSVIKANAAAVRMFGGDRMRLLDRHMGEVIGCKGHQVLPGTCTDRSCCASCPLYGIVPRLIRQGDSFEQQEIPLELYRDGEYRRTWIEYTAQAVSVDGVHGICLAISDITHHKEMELHLLEYQDTLQKSNQTLAHQLRRSIHTISKIGELRDAYTAGHQRKVMELACAIAGEMGLDSGTVDHIMLGALIHDIGKLCIPSDILNKPGVISPLEFEVLMSHAEYGYEIVKEIDLPWQIPTMIRQHHERMDGTGYPLKLRGDEIILESRVLAVADVVDAISSDRPYRPALGLDCALEEIRSNRGTKYDQDVVDACVQVLSKMGMCVAS